MDEEHVQLVLDNMNEFIHNKWGNKCQTKTYFNQKLQKKLDNIKESVQPTICLTQKIQMKAIYAL